jgi:hypothetical protein
MNKQEIHEKLTNELREYGRIGDYEVAQFSHKDADLGGCSYGITNLQILDHGVFVTVSIHSTICGDLCPEDWMYGEGEEQSKRYEAMFDHVQELYLNNIQELVMFCSLAGDADYDSWTLGDTYSFEVDYVMNQEVNFAMNKSEIDFAETAKAIYQETENQIKDFYEEAIGLQEAVEESYKEWTKELKTKEGFLTFFQMTNKLESFEEKKDLAHIFQIDRGYLQDMEPYKRIPKDEAELKVKDGLDDLRKEHLSQIEDNVRKIRNSSSYAEIIKTWQKNNQIKDCHITIEEALQDMIQKARQVKVNIWALQEQHEQDRSKENKELYRILEVASRLIQSVATKIEDAFEIALVSEQKLRATTIRYAIEEKKTCKKQS